METILEPAVYLVATPIGNLEDITLRAIRVLSSVDIIACEDTRHSGMLLKKLNIVYKKLVSYHEHNESEKSGWLINSVLAGNSVAVISDAGTPLISDPGFKLVALAIENNVKVVPIPGASSFLTALSACGMSVHRFTFAGFAPQKKGRNTFLRNILEIDNTVILFESCHRIEKLIDELFELSGDSRKICVARELTKMHEEFIRGNCSEIKDIIKSKKGLKGEIVVVLEGKNKDNKDVVC
ncbi:MAG: 16S rRNA (cytidine(1402)-2'-O)-methyltransferase [Candidatus Kapabacteria bacterium]|nr:16S rRNA (cytidine(1402)-2'-O)-methyltransferase [Candidatus Kapabacteria bacterium]